MIINRFYMGNVWIMTCTSDDMYRDIWTDWGNN
ncbi:hypothetical protein J501_4240, partial [Acinetobacter baumannii 96512]